MQVRVGAAFDDISRENNRLDAEIGVANLRGDYMCTLVNTTRIVQGAVSTLLGVLALAFISSYMVNVFFKNVLLVIILGVIHALVFLPVVLDTLMPYTDSLSWCVHNKRSLTLHLAAQDRPSQTKFNSKHTTLKTPSDCNAHNSVSSSLQSV